MLNWKKPTADLVPLMKECIRESGMTGSDTCAANIFLLREKYDTRIAVEDGFLYRWYQNDKIPGRSGVTFPLGKGNIADAIRRLAEDRRERNLPMDMILLGEDQIEELRSQNMEGSFTTDEANWDYVYDVEHLAFLPGKENNKKRNRVNRFMRRYPEWSIRYIDREEQEDLLADLLKVEERWLSAQEDKDPAISIEQSEIHEAVRLWNELPLIGAVIYAEDKPVAMTVASEINNGVYDILFEKSYGSYAQDGGFAMINKCFAEHLLENWNAKWINREEDMGIPGLRRAKMMYQPDLRFKKFEYRSAGIQ